MNGDEVPYVCSSGAMVIGITSHPILFVSDQPGASICHDYPELSISSVPQLRWLVSQFMAINLDGPMAADNPREMVGQDGVGNQKSWLQ